MQTIKTNRLLLRTLSLDDLSDFFNYARKTNIGPRAGWPAHQNVTQSLNILKLMIKLNDTWAIEYQKEMIGTITLTLKKERLNKINRYEMGYSLNDDYWNLGLATEAALAILNYGFNEKNLMEIYIAHQLENLASKRVIEKCGFIYSHMEKRLDFENKNVDVFVYKMTKRMYGEKKNEY